MMVGVTSERTWQTGDLVLRPGDHPAIKSDCVLSYASLKLVNVERIARSYLEIPKLVWAERRASAVTIEQIQDALLESGRLESRYVDLIAKARKRAAT